MIRVCLLSTELLIHRRRSQIHQRLPQLVAVQRDLPKASAREKSACGGAEAHRKRTRDFCRLRKVQTVGREGSRHRATFRSVHMSNTAVAWCRVVHAVHALVSKMNSRGRIVCPLSKSFAMDPVCHGCWLVLRLVFRLENGFQAHVLDMNNVAL